MTIFCCSIFFKEFHNSQARINKMVKKHTFDHHPSPSELASRIHLLIILRTPKGFIFPKFILNFFSNLCILPWSRKSLKLMVLGLPENTFVSKKINLQTFTHVPQAKLFPGFLSSPVQAEEYHPLPLNNVFWKSIFHQQKERRIMELKSDQN